MLLSSFSPACIILLCPYKYLLNNKIYGHQGMYSQHFIIFVNFVTYKWAKYAWVFVHNKPFQPIVM
jgi:hypothetical protein